MKTQTPSPGRRQQTKHEFVKPQGSLNYAHGLAVRSLPPLFTRVLVGGICLLVTGTVTWAAVSKVDEVATASGQVVPATQVQPMRSLASGSLRDINVAEGKHVNKGDVLIQLDPIQTKLEVQRLEQLVKLGRNTLARLEAEHAGKTQTVAGLQNQLLVSRLREFSNRLAAAKAESIQQFSVIQAAKVQKARLEADLTYASKKLKTMQTLAVEGAVPRFDFFDIQNKVASLHKEIAIQEQTIRQAWQSYQAAKINATRLEAERRSEILAQIEKQEQDLADLQGRLSQAREQQKGNTIRSGVSGTVYNIKVTKAGSLVHAGDELLSIVPDGEELLVEAKVPNQDIGFIRPQMKAKVKLATFPYQEYGMLEGTVSKISPNAVNEKDAGLVFPVQVKLKQRSVLVNGRYVQLTPGMATTAEIVTRQKTILSFLLDPITTNWDRAFSVR